MRKFLIGFVLGALLMTSCLSYAEQLNVEITSIPIYVNGKVIKSDVSPVIYNNRILVPIRAISEAFGALVNYEGDKVAITLNMPGANYNPSTNSNYNNPGTNNSVINADYYIRTLNGANVSLSDNIQVVIVGPLSNLSGYSINNSEYKTVPANGIIMIQLTQKGLNNITIDLEEKNGKIITKQLNIFRQ